MSTRDRPVALVIQHALHPHSLSLSNPPSFPGFRCNGCNRLGRGFRYRCDSCDFELHCACAWSHHPVPSARSFVATTSRSVAAAPLPNGQQGHGVAVPLPAAVPVQQPGIGSRVRQSLGRPPSPFDSLMDSLRIDWENNKRIMWDRLRHDWDNEKRMWMELLGLLGFNFGGREGSPTNETSPDHPQRNARPISPASSTDQTSHDHQQQQEREITIANYHRLATHILQHHPVEFVSLATARCVLCGNQEQGMGYQCLSCEFVLHEQCLNAITGYLDEMAAACARFPRSGGRRVQINNPPSSQTQSRSFSVQDGRSIQDSDSQSFATAVSHQRQLRTEESFISWNGSIPDSDYESFTTAVPHQRQLRTEESFISRNGSIPDSEYESFTTAIRDGVDAWVTASSSTLNMGSGSSHSDSVSEIETGTSEITEAAETEIEVCN